MNILIITGTIAENIIIKNIQSYKKYTIYIKVLPIPIAAFITPKLIVYHLKNDDIYHSVNTSSTCKLDDIDIILTPGLVKQDTEYIQEQLNIPTYKGSTNAADIKLTIDALDEITLSTKTPADKLIRQKQYEESMNIIEKYNKKNNFTESLLEKKENVQIGKCNVGQDFPMRVLGEIANATHLNENDLIKKVDYYINSGADMIDIGMTAGESNPKQAYNLIKTVKDNFDITVSIDSYSSKDINSALEAGADLVLSLDHGNYDKVIDNIKEYDAKSVIIPTNYSKNIIPKTPIQKVNSLEKLDEKCKSITTIADLLLDPINSPSLTTSIESYNLYRKQNPHKQIFFGIGNVSELLDADSNGANAVLSGIAMEIGASILFTPEASLKTKNSIQELKTASNMMFIAKQKNSIPKNLGINLIKLKDSYKKDDAKIDTSTLNYIEAVGDRKFIPDPNGSFKIIVEEDYIKAIYYINYEAKEVLYSKNARDIYETILNNNMISRLEHAAYLGMELEKAEIALKLNKEYIQDYDLF